MRMAAFEHVQRAGDVHGHLMRKKKYQSTLYASAITRTPDA